MIKFSKEKVLLLHQLIAEETGGSIGVRDIGLLEWQIYSIIHRNGCVLRIYLSLFYLSAHFNMDSLWLRGGFPVVADTEGIDLSFIQKSISGVFADVK